MSSLDIQLKLPSFCGTGIRMFDMPDDNGIRSHWRITAFFLRYRDLIVDVHTKEYGTLYLNKHSFNLWKQKHKVEQIKDPAMAIRTACANIFVNASKQVWTKNPLQAVKDMEAAETRLGNQGKVQNLQSLKRWMTDKLPRSFPDNSWFEMEFKRVHSRGSPIITEPKLCPKTLALIERFNTVVPKLSENKPLSEEDQAWLKEQQIQDLTDQEIAALQEKLAKDSLEYAISVKSNQTFKRINLIRSLESLSLSFYTKANEERADVKKRYYEAWGKIDQAINDLKFAEAETMITQTTTEFGELDTLWKIQLGLKASDLTPLSQFVASYPVVLTDIADDQLVKNVAGQMNQVKERFLKAAGEFANSSQIQALVNKLTLITGFYEKIKGKSFFADLTADQLIDVQRKLQLPGWEIDRKKWLIVSVERLRKRHLFLLVATTVKALFNEHLSAMIACKKLEDEADAALDLENPDFATALDKLAQSIDLAKLIKEEHTRLQQKHQAISDIAKRLAPFGTVQKLETAKEEESKKLEEFRTKVEEDWKGSAVATASWSEYSFICFRKYSKNRLTKIEELLDDHEKCTKLQKLLEPVSEAVRLEKEGAAALEKVEFEKAVHCYGQARDKAPLERAKKDITEKIDEINTFVKALVPRIAPEEQARLTTETRTIITECSALAKRNNRVARFIAGLPEIGMASPLWLDLYNMVDRMQKMNLTVSADFSVPSSKHIPQNVAVKFQTPHLIKQFHQFCLNLKEALPAYLQQPAQVAERHEADGSEALEKEEFEKANGSFKKAYQAAPTPEEKGRLNNLGKTVTEFSQKMVKPVDNEATAKLNDEITQILARCTEKVAKGTNEKLKQFLVDLQGNIESLPKVNAFCIRGHMTTSDRNMRELNIPVSLDWDDSIDFRLIPESLFQKYAKPYFLAQYHKFCQDLERAL